MKRIAAALLLAGLLILTAGCGVGIIYTHTYQPLSLDMHQTGYVSTEGQGDIKHLVLLLPQLSVAWDSAAIGDIAKKNGIHEIAFADLEILSVLRIWSQYTVHVYGR